MTKSRVVAFSDGVLAILITIMVLDLHAPHSAEPAALLEVAPAFLSYVLSFTYLAIYWNNHHHMFQTVERVDGSILWANNVLLFCLSLIPFTTSWMGENHFATFPVALYGLSLLLPALAYMVLQLRIIRLQGPDSPLAKALGGDWKGKLTLCLDFAGIVLAFATPLISEFLYVAAALMWLVPDPRIERWLYQGREEPPGGDAG